MGLSVGRDKTLRLWNLVKVCNLHSRPSVPVEVISRVHVQGRKSFVRRLPAPASLVLWAPDGETYTVVAGRRAETRVTDVKLPACELPHRVMFVTDTLRIADG